MPEEIINVVVKAETKGIAEGIAEVLSRSQKLRVCHIGIGDLNVADRAFIDTIHGVIVYTGVENNMNYNEWGLPSPTFRINLPQLNEFTREAIERHLDIQHAQKIFAIKVLEEQLSLIESSVKSIHDMACSLNKE